MASSVNYTDPEPNNFPKDYNQNQVDKRTLLRTTSVRTKMHGKDVREALAQTAEISSVVSGRADKNASESLSKSKETEKRFDNEIAGSTNNSEVVDARKPEGKNAYPVLGKRLNDIDKDIKNSNKNLKNNSLGIVNFCFDDSYRENRLTKQVFDSYGMVCDFAIITDKVNNATNDYQGISWYLEAQDAGYGIMSHTRKHTDISNGGLNYNDVYKEIVTSKQILKRLGLTTSGFVSPSSVTSSKYEDLIEQNYNYAVNHTAVNNENAPMDSKVDRYHLQRMSLTADINVIKKAIDKTVDQKLLLMFYDHRTGVNGSATEAKLKQILDYVKQKANSQQLKILKSVDAIAEYYGVNEVESAPTQAKANELALPIGRYLFTDSRSREAWNVVLEDSTALRYNRNQQITVTYDSNSKLSESKLYQVINLDQFGNEEQPHYLSINTIFNSDVGLANVLDLKAFAKCYDSSGKQLGNTEYKNIYISRDRIIYPAAFSFPRDARTVDIGYTFKPKSNVEGTLYIKQPTILLDQVGYTGTFNDQEAIMQVGYTPDFKTPRVWSFAKLPSFSTGIPRRYFDYDPNKNYFTCLIPGEYSFRFLSAYKVTNIGSSGNPRVLAELRINDSNANNTDALRRVQSSRSVGDIYNIDATQIVSLKAGDQVRIATDLDFGGTPTASVAGTSFAIIRKQ